MDTKRSTEVNWNHRVMKRISPDTGEPMYQIHEVFYYTDEDGKSGLVAGWTENGVAPFGLSEKKLRKDLQRMLDSMNKPVLDYETGSAISEIKDIETVTKNLKKLLRKKEKENERGSQQPRKMRKDSKRSD